MKVRSLRLEPLNEAGLGLLKAILHKPLNWPPGSIRSGCASTQLGNGNGNGRTARCWANLVFMRYGLPPVLGLRPRPKGEDGNAGAKGMHSNLAPMAALIQHLLAAASSSAAA